MQLTIGQVKAMLGYNVPGPYDKCKAVVADSRVSGNTLFASFQPVIPECCIKDILGETITYAPIILMENKLRCSMCMRNFS